MPRKSIVEEIADSHHGTRIKVELGYPEYLIAYNFISPPTRFYEALEKLMDYINARA